MKKLLILTIIFFALSAKSQNYNNIVNYNINRTPTHGAKIKTNLPFTNSNHMPTIKIEGYSHVDDTNINLTLSWYIFKSKFARMVMSSYGGITPDVWLANENGKVIIYLDMKMYYQRFTVSAFAQGMSEKPEYFTSWTVVDEALSGTEQTLVPYKNKFKTITTDGDISIGEHVEKTGLGGKLHLRGTASNTDHLWLAKYIRSNDQTDMRVNIGDFNNGDRFVIGTDLSSSWGELFTVSTLGTGRVGIGVSFPTCALDVNGTIRGKEVKIEATGWADFVFDPDSSKITKPITNKYARL